MLGITLMNEVPQIPEFSVSELAGSIKRTLESGFGRVRVRGELSRVKIHTSGHLYSDLKDENAVINVVCWRGSLARMSITPQEGMEVICTGKVSSYPARSNYQLIIDHMDLAGEGALLKLLEARKKKLAGEGLFAPERKQPLPFLPKKIGVVTSPTGAVFSDILHRLADRFPSHVVLWPVAVQGNTAASEITVAIEGFNSLSDKEKPDILIVGRGGGSLEDLMAFNEESVVRAIANSTIPVISAVGHETDTTLADYAADKRAPTPTGAAEMAIPVRSELLAQVNDSGSRLLRASTRMMDELKTRLQSSVNALGTPDYLFDIRMQKLDHLNEYLMPAFKSCFEKKYAMLREYSALLRKPDYILQNLSRQLDDKVNQFVRIALKIPEPLETQLKQSVAMLEALSFHRVLERGYSVIRDDKGKIIDDVTKAKIGQGILIEFKENKKVNAVITKKLQQQKDTQNKNQRNNPPDLFD